MHPETASGNGNMKDDSAQKKPEISVQSTTNGTIIEDDLEPAVCRFQVLSHEQVKRLHDVMEESVPIHGRGNFPTLDIKLKDLVRVVRKKLKSAGIFVRDIRLNGGAASHILASDRENLHYNDLDLIFGVKLSSARDLELVKSAVLESLLDFLPQGVNKERMSSCSLKEGYVHKMVKVVNNSHQRGDMWSLISLKNNKGKHVELKFVDTMKRQFEFSVDSFQIILDSLLLFYDCAEMPMSEHFYPTVVGESVFGDFMEAIEHLDHKIISTRNPEEIRGGGLLKYIHLLVRHYTPADDMNISVLERYMCSRFFIDFGDVLQQQQKLEKYLLNHFEAGDSQCKYDYLMTLYRVVDESTVCLMNHERRQTLLLIDQLAYREFLHEQQQQLFMAQQSPAVIDCDGWSVCSSSSGGSNSSSSNCSMSSASSSVSSCSSPAPSECGGFGSPLGAVNPLSRYVGYQQSHQHHQLPPAPYQPCPCAPCAGWINC